MDSRGERRTGTSFRRSRHGPVVSVIFLLTASAYQVIHFDSHSDGASILQRQQNATSSTRKDNDTTILSVPFVNLNTQGWGVFSYRTATLPPRFPDKWTWWQVASRISLPTDGKCTYILDQLENETLWQVARQKYSRRGNEHPFSLDKNNSQLKLLLIDGADRGSGKPIQRCIQKLAARLGKSQVHLAARNLVAGRNFGCFASNSCNKTTLFSTKNGTISRGQAVVTKEVYNGVIAKWDFSVRPDYLKALNERLGHRLQLARNVTHQDYFSYDRSMDVAHFWNKEGLQGVALRNRVTEILQELLETTPNVTGTAGLVSSRGTVGRTTVSDEYTDAMLNHKIIVVAQRDYWEDHFRLMEALISGAMVMSDPITFLPVGLEAGASIVFYNSLEELIQKVMYYLKDELGQEDRIRIAKAGRSVAVQLHQPLQCIERMVLGRWPTTWQNPVLPAL